MQPYGQPGFSGGYGQPEQAAPPAAGGAAPLNNPFGAAPAGGVRSSPFANAGGGGPPPAAPTAPFGAPGGGMAPPPSVADMQAKASAFPPPMGGAPGGFAPPPMGAPPMGAPPMGASAPPTGAAPAPMGAAAMYPQAAPAGMSHSVPGAAAPGVPANDAYMAAFLKDLDAFNSPKDFVRASVSKLPNSLSGKQKANLPLGIMMQPLAPESHDLVPDVNFGAAGGIVRCKTCRTYVNPFVQWEANGRRWTCNLCGLSQATPDTYYASLDETGRRSDRYQRPELHKGAVEYIAPGEYMVRPPQPPVFMFVIDVSFAAVSTGMLHAVVDSIKQAIQQQMMPGGQRLQVGIITYDTSLHFYNLNPNLSTPQMLVVSDLEDLFLPLPDDILVNAYDSESSIMSLLDQLPAMFQDTKISESCMGSAVKGAHLAMKHIGGKMLVFGACIPSVGECSLKSTRDQPKLLGTDKEVELLRPVNDAYKDLGMELTRTQTSVELFIGANAYVDLASIAPLAKYTGGDVRYYPCFHIATQGMKLKSELLHVLTRYMGWEAVMRVRVSRGWKITKFYGHLFIRGQDLLVVPNCHADQTFAVSIDMEENSTPDPVICIQSALLYTNSDGERRIRVHTWAGVTTQNFNDIIGSVDVQATTALLSNITMESCIKQTLAVGRNELNTKCQQTVQTNNMVNSESLAFLPLYIMGMLKSAALRGTNDISPDMRTFIWMRLENISTSQLAAYYYPRLMALHNVPEHCGVPLDESGKVQLPDQLNLTKDSMTQDGIYLLEDGETMLVWIGRAADPNTLQQVFGNGNIDELDTNDAELKMGTLGGPLSDKIGAILRQIRRERTVPYMQLCIVKGGDGAKELRFFAALIEDRTMAMQSTYMEFLQRAGYRPPQQQAGPPPGAVAGPPGMMR